MRQKIEIEIETPAGECTPTIYLPKEIIGNGFRFAFATEPTQPQPEPWKRWEPKVGETYFTIRGNGAVDRCCHAEITGVHGYVPFRTQELAERHAKRLRSMVPTCAMPKDGETFWLAVSRDHPEKPVVPVISLRSSIYPMFGKSVWDSSSALIWLFHMGRIFLTKEAAEAWIAEFGDVWTSRVDGEGE